MAEVSIRRADDWAFEPAPIGSVCPSPDTSFQSAGRMIGLLNPLQQLPRLPAARSFNPPGG